MRRTHTCGELNSKNVNQLIVLQGWVKKIRKMGAMNFVDLRDFYGVTQLVMKEKQVQDLKPESVIEITGKVVKRKNPNSELKTGAIEVVVQDVKIINQAKLLPFTIDDDTSALEDTRLSYRYLDLRRSKMQNNLLMRSQINSAMRQNLEELNFLEVETPFLAKSTPEGARDFLVPSRLNAHKFYALPQSPQLFKQLLMVGGIDRYYQIVRCFRDEDLRNDRQLEFTQLDLEMNFATPEDVIFVVENLMSEVFKKVLGVKITLPFKRMTYHDAIQNYGTDKPDLRYDLKIHNLTKIFAKTEVKLLKPSLTKKLPIKGIMIDKLLSKSQIAQLEETAKQNHLSGLGFVKYENEQWSGSLASQLSESEKKQLIREFEIGQHGTILINGGRDDIIAQALGAVRVQLGAMFNLANLEQYEFLWVVDFPLFEWSEEDHRYVAAHHPFTMPKTTSLKDFDKKQKEALASAYDIVLNGYEIGGGSQRITDQEIQKRMFKAVGLNAKKVEENFGWFINAYQYGAAYHSGLALGIDRIAIIMSQAESIRDVIAFPKNSNGVDLMSDAPSYVSAQQLKELSLDLKK